VSGDRVLVGDVLSLERREVELSPTVDYEEIGIRSFGRGIFHKPPMKGSELGSKRVFRIEPGDLILSNVFAWEGAVAVASEAEAGKIGSHRFMTFTPRDPGQIDTGWAAWFFRSEPGLSLIRKASPGSAGRNRTLGIKRFASLEMPLPPLQTQARIARRLDAIRSKVSRIEEAQTEATDFGEAAVDGAAWDVFRRGILAEWPTAPLGEVAEINPSRDRLPPEQPVGWVPMEALDERTGTSSPDEREAGAARSGYRQFRKGDVLFAKITPSMQNGKCAIFAGPHGHGYGSTEFHVIRPQDGTQARWIHRFLRTKEIRMQAAKHFTGTAGQQRVPADFLRSLEIPVPPKADQIAALQKIDRIAETGATLLDRRAKSSELRAAIEPAVLNQVFSSAG
jgi:type I restriction enzyme S subunit